MMTSVSFITNILIITGEWGQYSNKEIASIIAHEIGHGGVFAKYIIFFCEFLIKTIAVFLFLKVIENLVKNLKSTIDTRKLKVFFVYLNLYILRLLLTLLNNIFSQTIEYHADKMSIKIMKNDHSLQNMLFKMFINQKFKNENIKYIKIKQYDTNFNLEELESFGKKFVNAKIKLNDIGLTVDRIVIHEKQEKEKEYLNNQLTNLKNELKTNQEDLLINFKELNNLEIKLKEKEI
ncbi:hypothetical protein TUBRATIS_12290, partial [Tubulinosema ratisbonensis]